MQWTPLIIFAIDFSLRLLMCGHLLMRRRQVATTFAWLLFLITVPLLGIVLYPLMGDPRLGTFRAKRSKEVAAMLVERCGPLLRPTFEGFEPGDDLARHNATLGTRVSGMPPVPGNQLELLSDTREFLARVAGEIDQAKHYCHLLYYIYSLDAHAGQVSQALIRAAKRGLECRLLVDGAGSSAFLRSDLHDEMLAAGVKVVEALPVRMWRVFLQRIDLRNHRKIAIIDGEVAYTGSHNLTDAAFPKGWFGSGGTWRDTSVRMVGPAVQALQLVFLRDWLLDSEEDITNLDRYLRVPHSKADGCIVHVIPSGPGPEPEAIHHALLMLLFSAREEIMLTTPYFVPDESTKTALIIAACRGVAVTIVVPRSPDAPLVGAAARSHFDDLLLAGVRIMRHDHGALHAKTFTIDRRIAVITSVNFDQRSFWLNFESSLFIYDRDFAAVLRMRQMSYIRESQELDKARWLRRPGIKKLFDQVVQLLGPVL